MRRFWRTNRGAIVFILLLFTVRGAIADWSPVPTGSMKPTILEGDVLLIDRLAYDVKLPFSSRTMLKLDEPERGDIVVFRLKGDDKRLVKRLIGLPGDSVEMQGNRLKINGQWLPYTALPELLGKQAHLTRQDSLEWLDAQSPHFVRKRFPNGGRGFSVVQVPQGHYLMLGDNRDNSGDSRAFGFVPRSALIGKSERLLASFDTKQRYLPRFSRWGHLLDQSTHIPFKPKK